MSLWDIVDPLFLKSTKACNPILRRQKEEGHKFKATLGCKARPCLNKKKIIHKETLTELPKITQQGFQNYPQTVCSVSGPFVLSHACVDRVEMRG